MNLAQRTNIYGLINIEIEFNENHILTKGLFHV